MMNILIILFSIFFMPYSQADDTPFVFGVVKKVGNNCQVGSITTGAWENSPCQKMYEEGSGLNSSQLSEAACVNIGATYDSQSGKCKWGTLTLIESLPQCILTEEDCGGFWSYVHEVIEWDVRSGGTTKVYSVNKCCKEPAAPATPPPPPPVACSTFEVEPYAGQQGCFIADPVGPGNWYNVSANCKCRDQPGWLSDYCNPCSAGQPNCPPAVSTQCTNI